MAIADLKKPSPASFKIVIDGQALPVEMNAQVAGITVDDTVALPSMFLLELMSSARQSGLFDLIDDPRFAPGKSVDIKLGYANDLDSVIKGEITALEPDYKASRWPSLFVRGYDRRHRLQRATNTRTFLQQKDSDIAAKIAVQAGLTASTVDSGVTHEYVIQVNQTDLDFLQQRARLIQFEVLADDKKLIFRPVSNAENEKLTITMGDHLFEFYPRLSSSLLCSDVNVRGWNVTEKKAFDGKAQASDVVSKMGGLKVGPEIAQSAFGNAVRNFSSQYVRTQAEAEQIARAYINNQSLSLIKGEGSCRGRTDLRAGTVIKIDSLGKRFSGKYYVTSASHRYNPQSGYYTVFNVWRNAT
jgi:phage protein D